MNCKLTFQVLQNQEKHFKGLKSRM